MTFHNTVQRYADEAYNTHYRAEMGYPELKVELGTETPLDFIARDLRDLYKNGNLEDAFPSLDSVSGPAYHDELTLIYMMIPYIARRISALLDI